MPHVPDDGRLGWICYILCSIGKRNSFFSLFAEYASYYTGYHQVHAAIPTAGNLTVLHQTVYLFIILRDGPRKH